ncbi:Disease resistance protein (CC-NBS-LRR class) family [Abeliophyllum distichum]|uniref:Disease resistance protein (CC-NBS-LRR class) family n=1 Tax=Abeliophyllum distichum TaxID=126358 RepID=A0ABD1RD49_9LAMI
MVDAIVRFTLDSLKDLLVSLGKKINEVDVEVQSLSDNLKFFNGFLIETSKKPIKDQTMEELVKQTRQTVYDAGDIVDQYVIEAAEYKTRGKLSKMKHPLERPSELFKLAQKIVPVKRMVDGIYKKKEFVRQDGERSNTTVKKAPIVEEDHVVGMEDEATKVINLLITKSEELEITTIAGMPGLGKTTLAKKIFLDRRIEYEFHTRVWVYVSQDCNRKEVFLAIMEKIGKVTDEMRNMTAENLANILFRSLEEKKCLIVMDDVWTQKDWNDLQIAFPKIKNRIRILLTSRDNNVGKSDKCKVQHHDLRSLNLDESRTLLMRKALGSEECPKELIKHGNDIADKCDGLPLSIVVIGGILLEKGTNVCDWEDVSKDVMGYIVEMDKEKVVNTLIGWSFYGLDYHLKVCFIYFGMLPQDYRISVRKLIRLWIAEGYIQPKGEIILETIAENYLTDLVNRNLVMVEKWSPNGKIKTCYVHDMMHVFCKNKALDENFYHVIKQSNQNIDSSSNDAIKKCRGLSIPPHFVKNISRERFGSHVRSFLCFSNDEITLLPENISSISKTFKLLRVLDGEPIRFSRFPPDLDKLVHLRYLILSINFKTLPKHITNLWNIETLVVKTSSNSLEIKGDIWKMIRLRHLETNASTSFPDIRSKKRNNEEGSLTNLRTFSTISPETCTRDVFDRAPNLSKLGIRGQLAKLFEVEGGSSLFDNVKRLNSLENLKLFNDVLAVQDSKGKIDCLPDKFPPNLKKLTLYGTELDWMCISTLGKLENLEILKLKENAFKGNKWVPKDGGFPVLKVLHIGRTDLVTWDASATHFPSLKSLHLRHCDALNAVPSDLAKITSLQTMELYHTNKKAACFCQENSNRTSANSQRQGI